jgi:hypothetical protein
MFIASAPGLNYMQGISRNANKLLSDSTQMSQFYDLWIFWVATGGSIDTSTNWSLRTS